MSPAQKPSRTERQVRNQARGLLLVSVMLLVACAAMTGIFGWTLGRSPVEKVVFSVGLVGVDLAGAYLMAFSGTCSATLQQRAARVSFLSACTCMCITFTGILGFQSESRESRAMALRKAAEISDSYIDWAKETTGRVIEREKAEKKRGKPAEDKDLSAAFGIGLDGVGKAVHDHVNRLMSGEIATVDDGQAATISRLTMGLLPEASARSWVTAITSAAFIAIQYAALWAYGFLRHNIEPILAARNAVTGRRLAAANSANSANGQEYSEPAAREDFNRLLGEGFDPTRYGAHSFLARRWGWTNHRVARWLRAQPNLGIPPPAKRQRRVNGNGQIHVGGT